MTSERTRELQEIEACPRVLVIDVQPGIKPPMHIRMAQEMFRQTDEAIEAYPNLVVTKISAPSIKEKLPTAEREERSTLKLPDTTDLASPYQAVVITGSPFAAYPRDRDGRPFMVDWKYDLVHYVRGMHERGTPILGICYGAQIIAEALGGKVERMKREAGGDAWEVGWSIVERRQGSTDDPILQGLPSRFVVHENRKDTIVQLPPEAILLADNAYGVQGFRVGNTWALQFHPERLPEKNVDYLGKESVQEEMREHGLDPDEIIARGEFYSPEVRRIFSRFLKVAWQGAQ